MRRNQAIAYRTKSIRKRRKVKYSAIFVLPSEPRTKRAMDFPYINKLFNIHCAVSSFAIKIMTQSSPRFSPKNCGEKGKIARLQKRMPLHLMCIKAQSIARCERPRFPVPILQYPWLLSERAEACLCNRVCREGNVFVLFSE